MLWMIFSLIFWLFSRHLCTHTHKNRIKFSHHVRFSIVFPFFMRTWFQIDDNVHIMNPFCVFFILILAASSIKHYSLHLFSYSLSFFNFFFYVQIFLFSLHRLSQGDEKHRIWTDISILIKFHLDNDALNLVYDLVTLVAVVRLRLFFRLFSCSFINLFVLFMLLYELYFFATKKIHYLNACRNRRNFFL